MSQKLVLYVLLAVVSAVVSLSSLWADEAVEIMAGRVTLKFKDNVSESEKAAFVKNHDLVLLDFSTNTGIRLYQSKDDNVLPLVEKIKTNPIIEFAEANYVQKKRSVPNDPLYANQWYLPKIKMPEAWGEFTGTSIIKVAVIDCGVSKYHNEISPTLISQGEWDYVDLDSDANDEGDSGHGTLIAGIIAAVKNNLFGISGISDRVRILPIRTFDSDGADPTENALAIERAADNGCKVIVCSFGGYNFSTAQNAAINYANSKGVLVVCAAGNESNNNDINPFYPASYTQANVISVANSISTDALSSYSNYGASSVDISAPGTDIYSTQARKKIAEWKFDTGWDGWDQSITSGLGFFWGSVGLGLYTRVSNLNGGFYQSDSSILLYSPLFACTEFEKVKLKAEFEGGLGSGDFIGVQALDSEFHSYDLNWVSSNDDLERDGGWTFDSLYLPKKSGRFSVYFYSDELFNDFFGLIKAEVIGFSTNRVVTSQLFESASGTSFSAPVVAGVAAMLMSQNPSLTHLQIKDIILQTARKVSALNGKVVSGGIVDAAAALREAKARMVVAPAITSSRTASATVGTAFSYTIRATNTPTSFNATGRPAWMSVNTNTGVISGTPTAAGTHNITISASNAAGSGSATLTLTVTGLAPLITSSTTATGAVGSAFTYTITASRSPASYNATGLPSGFSVNRTNGTISGTPTKAGTNNITISASNSFGVGTAVLSLRVSKGNPRIISLPAASKITDDQTLGQSSLTGGSASISGSFSWGTPSLVPLLPSSLQTVKFTPVDGSNYNSVNSLVGITVIESTNRIKILSNCLVAAIAPASLQFNGTSKAFFGKAAPTNVSSRTAVMLGSIGDPVNGYGIVSSLGATSFRSVTNLGIDGVFRPHRASTVISSTGLRFAFPSNLVSSNPGGDTARPPWKSSPESTGGSTGGISTHFTALGINWQSNSLFAVPCAGVTYDLSKIKPAGRMFIKFTTYFAMHSGNPAGDAAYAILVDGKLLKSGTGFTPLNPYSDLIEINLPLNSRFLTLVVADNGDDYDWDHGVFVNPTLYANTEIPTTTQYVGINQTVYGPSTNAPTNAGDYRLSITDSSSRYTGTYTTNFTIAKANPVITRAPTPSVITFGQFLASSTLSNGLANVAGTFGWVTPTNQPARGTNLQSVRFVPAATNNYNTITSSISVIVR